MGKVFRVKTLHRFYVTDCYWDHVKHLYISKFI